ncbi:MAG: YraN family protein [Inquilinaceae bacterium]
MTEAARRQAFLFGFRAESLCVLVLRLKGYRILARRFRCPVGEIDIVARRGSTLVAVEVKARRDRDAALASLSAHQRRRVERATTAFLAARPFTFAPQSVGIVRFDVMVVAPRRWPLHIINAWQTDGAR